MKFFGKLFKRKEITVVGKEILNTYNIFLSLFQTSFYKRLLYHQFLCCGCSKLFRGGEMYPFERPVLCFANVSRLHDRSSGGG